MITGIITTLNESKNIEACIRSLQRVCDEVIVTDSCSKDDTVALAEKAGARVFVHPYIGIWSILRLTVSPSVAATTSETGG